MIKVIVFDIGNVLARFGWEDHLVERGYEEETARRIGNATVQSRLWKELDRSVTMDKELIARFVAQDPAMEKEITDFLDHSCFMVQEYGYSVELVKRLKEDGYQVYLLSNYGGRNYHYARDYFHFLEYVDGGVISYEVGYVKPEPEIYDALIKKYDINPEEAIYIDDLKENVRMADTFGFHTILFVGYEQLVTSLEKFKQNTI